jgi:hypothetical protein
MTAYSWPSRRVLAFGGVTAAGLFLAGFGYGYAAPPPPCDGLLPGALVEADIAYVETALNLTGPQLTAWKPVADALRVQAKHRDAEIKAKIMQEKTSKKSYKVTNDVILGLEEEELLSAAEADDLTKLIAVVKPFYALLDTNQKESVEEVLPFGPPEPGDDCLPPSDGDGPRPAHPPF